MMILLYLYGKWKNAKLNICNILLCLASILHFLSNGGIFLKQEVYIHIKVAGLNTPRHTTNNLSRGEKKEEEWGESGEGKVKPTVEKRGPEEETDKEEEERDGDWF